MTNEDTPTLEAGQVWRISFRFEDKPEISKLRPAALAVLNHAGDEALMVKITSHPPRAEFPGEILIKDWQAAGLDHASTLRCSKIAAVSLETLKSSKLLGQLGCADLAAMQSAIAEIYGS